MQEDYFEEIDPAQIDFSQARFAQKTAKVTARTATEGERVDTIMKNGLVETTNTAKAGDYVVTNPGGEQYLVGKEKFEKRYVPTDNPNVFAPNAAPVKVLELDRNVSFKAPWGETMNIRAGGVLVSNGPGDVYGIQPDEFKETYSYRPDLDAVDAKSNGPAPEKSLKVSTDSISQITKTTSAIADALSTRSLLRGDFKDSAAAFTSSKPTPPATDPAGESRMSSSEAEAIKAKIASARNSMGV